MADYGLLAGLGEGLKAGIGGYQQAKQLGLQQQQLALENQRASNTQQMQMGEAGYEQTPEGILQPTAQHAQELALKSKTTQTAMDENDPTTPASQSMRARAKAALNASSPGLGDKYVDNNTSAAQLKADPYISKLLPSEFGLAGKGLMATALATRQQNTIGAGDERQQNRIDAQQHAKTVQAVKNDPALRTRLTQFQNLDNTLSNLTKSDHLTPEQIMETQQAVRANLGIKGSSGVSEREADYIHSLGLNAERFKEFLTGQPADISKNNEILGHIKNLAQLEQQNIRDQYKTELDSASEGFGEMYDRRPDYKASLDKLLKAKTSQLGGQGLLQPPASTAPQTTTPTAPAGLVKPKIVIQNGHTYNLNPQTGQYE